MNSSHSAHYIDPAHVAKLDDDALDLAERKIAGHYMQKTPWIIVFWGLTNCLVWLLLWPLVLIADLSLWVAFPVATLCCTLAYLPSHDAQHSIIAREGHELRWLNELVGWASLIPLAQAYSFMRATHMEHHAHTNNPELDPDFGVHAPSAWQFFIQSIRRRQPGSSTQQAHMNALERTGQRHLVAHALLVRAAYFVCLGALAWTGHALEAFLLWWLPLHIGTTYLQFYLSWMPHHPGIEQGRYRQTRGFKSKLGNLMSMGMQYHIIHHLYPRIPLHLTPAAFRDLLPILRRRGSDVHQWGDGDALPN